MSNKLMSLVRKAKYNKGALIEVINEFEPKLKKSLYNTNQVYREDLSQELKCKLIHCVQQYDVDSVPGFWDLQAKFK
ncbi:MAG: helix-turn-helix domain-containing protein [Lysinibacillus sp.]